jgi:hypothetical protein
MTDGGRRAMPAGDMRYRSMNMGRRPPDMGNRMYGGNDRRMQDNSRSAPERNNLYERSDREMNARESPREQNIQRPAGNNGFDLGRMLGGIKLDEEKIIIILLIVILARNGADLPLLAALGYLLL